MVAAVETIENLTGYPSPGAGQDGAALGSFMPFAGIELIDLVAGFFPEERCQVVVVLV